MSDIFMILSACLGHWYIYTFRYHNLTQIMTKEMARLNIISLSKSNVLLSRSYTTLFWGLYWAIKCNIIKHRYLWFLVPRCPQFLKFNIIPPSINVYHLNSVKVQFDPWAIRTVFFFHKIVVWNFFSEHWYFQSCRNLSKHQIKKGCCQEHTWYMNTYI